jgi:hypothetical protein
MAEDKKPKIDLKSRLQKMGGPGAATPPPPIAGIPQASPSRPPPPVMARPTPQPGIPGAPISIPPPSGIPKPPMSSRPVSLDANNPLAAMGQPLRQQTGAPPAYQAQRIEVDEIAIHSARSSARKQGFVGGLFLAVVLGGLGYVTGGAQQQGADRKKSSSDAHELAGDVIKAKGVLDDIKGKLSDGGKSLLADRKYPVDLGKTLSGMVVDFSGDKLFGRRFSGVPADTLKALMDFMARVAAFNNKRELVVSLLTSTKLQKSITEDLARPAGQSPVTLVAVVDKDTPGGACRIASLVKPIAPNDTLGKTLRFTNPLGGSGDVELPILQDPKIPASGAVIPIIPTSFDKVCPSPVKGAQTQLLSTMNSLIDDIQGQPPNPDYPEQGATPGLSAQAATIADGLNKVN